jgi:hypothetical protein
LSHPPRPDDAFAEGFESDVRATPPELERLVRDGIVKVKRPIRQVERVAKYVLIDDEDSFSLLRQMFYFAHSPNCVTVFRYNSVPSHTLFLVGQNASQPDVWPRLRKVVAADQRTSSKTDQRGRVPDVYGLHGMLNVIVRGGGNQTLKATVYLRRAQRRAAEKAMRTPETPVELTPKTLACLIHQR